MALSRKEHVASGSYDRIDGRHVRETEARAQSRPPRQWALLPLRFLRRKGIVASAK